MEDQQQDTRSVHRIVKKITKKKGREEYGTQNVHVILKFAKLKLPVVM